MQKNQNPPFLAAFAGVVSVQTGAAFAKTLFSIVDNKDVAALHLGISPLVLLAVFRPWTLRKSEVSWGAMILYGIVLALMNLLIYRAFAYIPISITISIEAMGPLIATLLTPRQKTDLLWILPSASGLFLLAAGDINKLIDVRGVVYSLTAASFWEVYVIVGRGVSGGGGRSAAAGMTIAVLIAVPLGTAQAGSVLLLPGVLITGLCATILSSMLPFLLDMYAVRWLPPRVLGVLLSGSPTVNALAGWIILNEKLNLLQCGGILSMMAACAGCTLLTRPHTLS